MKAQKMKELTKFLKSDLNKATVEAIEREFVSDAEARQMAGKVIRAKKVLDRKPDEWFATGWRKNATPRELLAYIDGRLESDVFWIL